MKKCQMTASGEHVWEGYIHEWRTEHCGIVFLMPAVKYHKCSACGFIDDSKNLVTGGDKE